PSLSESLRSVAAPRAQSGPRPAQERADGGALAEDVRRGRQPHPACLHIAKSPRRSARWESVYRDGATTRVPVERRRAGEPRRSIRSLTFAANADGHAV